MESIFNTLYSWVIWGINNVLFFLPDSPFDFSSVPSSITDVLGYVNYFIPVGQMLTVFSGWLACVTIWYVYSVILRWVKAVE